MSTFEPQQTASSPSPKPQVNKDSDACTLLTAKDRRSIAGERIKVVAPLQVTKGVLQCRWVKTLKTPLTTSIKVFSQPVQNWAQTVPRQIDKLIRTGQVDDKWLKRLQAAKQKTIREADEISDSDACDVFALLVRINEGRKNASDFTLYQGTGRGDFTVAWHRCGGGAYTVLTYAEPGLVPSVALNQSMARLGKLVHQRAIKLL